LDIDAERERGAETQDDASQDEVVAAGVRVHDDPVKEKLL
jgi:hypothetical protein